MTKDETAKLKDLLEQATTKLRRLHNQAAKTLDMETVNEITYTLWDLRAAAAILEKLDK